MKKGKLFGHLIIIVVLLGVLCIGLGYVVNKKTVINAKSTEAIADKAFSNNGLISEYGFDTKSKFLDDQLKAHNFSGTVLFFDKKTVEFQKPYANQDFAYRIPNTINTMYPNDNLTLLVNLVLIDRLVENNELNTNEKISAFNINDKYRKATLNLFLKQAKNVYKNGTFIISGKTDLMKVSKYNQYCREIIGSISSKRYQNVISENINKKIGLASFGTYATYKNSMNIAQLYETDRKTIQYNSKVKVEQNTVVATPLSFATFMTALLNGHFGLTDHQLNNIRDIFESNQGEININYNADHQYMVSSFNSKDDSGYVIMGNYSPATSFENLVLKSLGQDTVKEK